MNVVLRVVSVVGGVGALALCVLALSAGNQALGAILALVGVVLLVCGLFNRERASGLFDIVTTWLTNL